MWRSWGNKSSSTPSSTTPSTSTSTSKSSINEDEDYNKNRDKRRQSFRCSSFKDIENLCLSPQDSDYPNIYIYNNNSNNNSSFTPTKRHSTTTPCRSVFHRVRTANALLRQWGPPPRSDPPKPPIDDPCIVVYYTSLRVIRPTFEACRAVQSILQGFRVAIDERDLAMDSGFMTELRELLGTADNKLSLPRVFIGGRYIGGAEEVKQLHEVGELKNLIAGLPLAKPGTCNTCGGYRFILCTQCSGSHKIFSEKTGFRSCTVCNENGLIRCPDCSSPPPTRPVLAPINSSS